MSSIRHCVYRSRATNHKINYIIERSEMLINLFDINNALGYVDMRQLNKWRREYEIQYEYNYYIDLKDFVRFFHRLRKGTKETRERLLEELETLKTNNSFINGRINNRVIDHSVERQEILQASSLSNIDNEMAQLSRRLKQLEQRKQHIQRGN